MVASSKQFLVPAGTAGPVGGGYSHEVSAGGVVYVAGQMHGPVAGGAAPTSSEPRSAPSTLQLKKIRNGTSCALAQLDEHEAGRQDGREHERANGLRVINVERPAAGDRADLPQYIS